MDQRRVYHYNKYSLYELYVGDFFCDEVMNGS